MAIDVLKRHLPGVQEHGINTDVTGTWSGSQTFSGSETHSGTETHSGSVTFSGATAGLRRTTESVSAATKAVTAAESGEMFVDVQGTGTTTFTLPDAVAGLTY